MNKSELRLLMKTKRQNLKKEEAEQKSNEICRIAFESDIYKKAKTIAVYMSVGNEVSLQMLAKRAFEEKKRIFVPVTETNEIYFSELLPCDELAEGKFGIKEPKMKRRAETADLIFVPGLAFSKKGERLGWGGGYYDRFFAATNATKVGVGYDFQLTDEIASERHDVKMDYILTESGLIACE